MDIEGIENFFGVNFELEPGAVNPGDLAKCEFEKGGLKYELRIMKSENRLYINGDKKQASYNATPAIELNVQFDELEFKEYEGIEKGMMFIWKGIKQNLYISRLKNGYSISFSCNT